MKLILIIQILIKKIRIYLFPTLREREVKRWLSDDGEKFRYDYDLNCYSLVFDVGGYKGQWASDIYSMYNCRIMVFEPVKSFAANIEERFRRNKNIEVFSIALGRSRRLETIALGNDGSSVFKESASKETIQFEDIIEFFAEKNINNVDLMKVNIEGGEYELLDRMIESNLIAKVRCIQIQFHDFVPDATRHMEQISNRFSKTHHPTFQYKFVWDNWERNDY